MSRQYRPKPLDAGQWLEWEHETGGHWTGQAWGEGEWVPPETVARQGTIWSAGPVPGSLWVLPDGDPGGAVAVKLPGKRARARGHGPRQMSSFTAQWWRDAVRRANAVTARGAVYPAVEQTREVWRGYGRETEQVLVWHADPACPDAAGKDRAAFAYPEYSVQDVTGILIGRIQPASPPPFCRRCIYLEPPATTDRSA